MRYQLILILYCCNAWSGNQTSKQPLPQAQNQHPKILACQQTVREQNRLWMQSKAKLLPKISLNAGPKYYCHQQGYGHSVQLQISQKLFNLSSFKKIKLARLKQTLAEQQLILEQHKIQCQIQASTINLWQEQQKQPWCEQLLNSAKLNWQQAQQQHTLKLSHDLSFVQQQNLYLLAEYKASEMQSKQAIAFSQLAFDCGMQSPNEMGHNCITAQELTAIDCAEQKPKQFYVALALNQHPEIALAHSRIEEELLNEQLIFGRLWPEISCSLNFEQQTVYGCKQRAPQLLLGINCQWELHDWLTYQCASDAAMARRLKAEAELLQLRQQLKNTVTQAHTQLEQKTQLLNYQNLKTAEQQANWNYKQVMAKNGLLSKPKLADAALEWQQAQLELVKAKADQLQAQNVLQNNCGNCDPKILNPKTV